MYGHVPDYLNAQALRLRAERAERLAKMWRLTGWAFGLALVCLLTVVLWQERQLTESHAYSSHAERSEREAHKATWACEADLEWVRKAQFQHFTDLGRCQTRLEMAEKADMPTALCSQQAADIDDARIAAERKFKGCLAANAGLVESLQEFDRLVKDQQALIVESVELAKRCEVSPVTWAETPMTWATEAPAAWQVVGHAR